MVSRRTKDFKNKTKNKNKILISVHTNHYHNHVLEVIKKKTVVAYIVFNYNTIYVNFELKSKSIDNLPLFLHSIKFKIDLVLKIIFHSCRNLFGRQFDERGLGGKPSDEDCAGEYIRESAPLH